MAEFQEVMKQAERMCKAHDECECCPIKEEMDDLGEKCPFCGALGVAAVEQKIMRWAASHPEPRYPTWQQWWKDNFPDASEAFPPCRGYFMDLGDRRKECRISCEKCKNQPIPADIAEKLGIKPIGGGGDEK